MLPRLTRTYLFALFAAVVCLSVFSFGMSVAAVLRPNHLPDIYPTRLFFVTFAGGLLVLPLARDRNIWAHEVKLCPKPLRIAVRSGFVYGLVGIAYGILTGTFSPGILAFCTGFTLGLICILYAVLLADASPRTELPGRIGVSYIAIAVCVALYWADRSGYLLHTR